MPNYPADIFITAIFICKLMLLDYATFVLLTSIKNWTRKKAFLLKQLENHTSYSNIPVSLIWYMSIQLYIVVLHFFSLGNRLTASKPQPSHRWRQQVTLSKRGLEHLLHLPAHWSLEFLQSGIHPITGQRGSNNTPSPFPHC